MILAYLHKKQQLVACLMFWILGTNFVLPAFAGSTHPYNASYHYNLQIKNRNSRLFPTSSNNLLQPVEPSFTAKPKSLPDGNDLVLHAQGPSQPEMASFKSIGTDNMVDPFSGDFSYNIPLLDVGGYPISMHYNSGIGMDDEASWVGLGWNINPGTINRNMRGLPDDFNGVDSISKTISTKPNINLSVSPGLNVELAGFPIDYSKTLSYDNYRGYGIESSFGTSLTIAQSSRANAGSLTGSLSFTNSSSEGIGIGLGVSYTDKITKGSAKAVYGESNFGASLNYNSRVGLTALGIKANTSSLSYDLDGSISFCKPTFVPKTEIPYTSVSTSFNFKYGVSIALINPNFKASAQMGVQFIAPNDTIKHHPAYGYLYFSKAKGDEKALLDYNRENDGPFVDKVTPAIAIPQFTYDVYTISAEGTGGTFRPYRSDAGAIYSAYNRTNSGSLSMGLDIGLNKVGANFTPVYSYTQTKNWESDNFLRDRISFQQKDSVFEDVVFRNPMEMPIQSTQYLDAIGHDTLIRPILSGSGVNAALGAGFAALPDAVRTAYTINVNKNVVKEKREKRNQVISYLTAAEASAHGLDKNILSYKQGYTPFTYCVGGVDTIIRYDKRLRKSHHLSEITVLNEDGRRYVYGVPAYNISQQNMTFAVNPTSIDLAKGQCSYTDQEVSTKNKSGVDGYFSSERVPGYAHSFLLSGILSSDYVDVTGDGISDDDLGDAIKFGYTRVYDEISPFGWRMPQDPNKASFNTGLKTYKRDDKASIVKGEKEVWYLHSVISKNMVAVFRAEKLRTDVVSQTGTNGDLDNSRQLMRLTRIDLYTKAALVAGGTPKPVKSVFFEYDYSLCKKTADPSSGKLTLKKVYFTYNGNDTKKSNPYIFTYNGLNPSYQSRHTDAWGNYKDPASNPAPNLLNDDYPYIPQNNRSLTDQYASAWSLSDITLPSKGSIKVTYEADDYAYVQNKKATQFFKVEGLGRTQYERHSVLYPSLLSDDNNPYKYVIVSVPSPVYTKSEIYSKYLDGIKTLYLKMFVNMPGDRWGSGGEYVPMVCEIEDYGLVSPFVKTRIWIKIKSSVSENTIRHYAFQYLREFLPSKAYPGSEIGTDPDLKGIISMIGSQVENITTAAAGFDFIAQSKGVCRDFDTSRSFVKLTNPFMNKAGGGLRVKRIQISDNFNGMTGNQMKAATYGQDYDYTTTTTIVENSQPKVITISSGVATYEPFIGGEENALKGHYAYQQQLAVLGPVSNKFIDTPFCESLLPAASVGYSKVTIKSINRGYVSSTGKEVYTFYTYKDFPTRWSFTPFDDASRKRHKPAIGNFLKINSKHYLTLSQGFKVEINDMHGKLRSHAFYSENDTLNPITYTENIYRTKTIAGDQQTLDNSVWATGGPEMAINTKAAMGQGVEIMTDLREQSSFNGSANVQLNVDFLNLVLVTIPWFGIMAWPNWEKTRFRSASVLKVVNNYGILDSVYQVDKGSVIGTKNLVYDSETGSVLLTRTNNEFKDAVYNFTYPAHWAYAGMGMAYKNIHAEFGKGGSLKLRNGKLYDLSDNAFPMERYFESGDECVITGMLISSDNQANPQCSFYNVSDAYFPSDMKVWAINAKKDSARAPQVFLMDRNGRPVNANGVTVKILRSGFRNLIGAAVGNVTMLENPISGSVGAQSIVIDNSKKIVNAAAATFKDCWKVDNNFYAKDTTVRVFRSKIDSVKATVTLARKRLKEGGNGSTTSYNSLPVYMIGSRDWIQNCFGDNTTKFFTKGIMHFDLPENLVNTSITTATLKLWPKPPQNLWERVKYGCGPFPSHYSNDWSLETYRWRTGTINPRIRRMTGNFNNSTPYDQLLTTTANSVNLSSYNGNFAPINVNVTALTNALLANPAGGFNVALEDSIYSDGLAFMSFAAKDETIEKPLGSDPYAGAETKPGPGHSTLYQFKVPQLTFSYTTFIDSTYTVCRKSITDTTNPYRWGIYGNWRPDRSFVYYHERFETDPTLATNIRANGTLAAFVPFWEPSVAGASPLKPTTDTTRWVWNTVSTLVNRKGAEVEAVDALGRYSSGHFGYNDNLPVAVVQNAMYRQATAEGFEDYLYKDQYCNNLCPNPRFADFTKFTGGTATLVDTMAHTGLYSIRVAAHQAPTVEFPLSDTTNSYRSFPCDTCGFKIKLDSTAILDTVVFGRGFGMNRTISGGGYTTSNCNIMNTIASVSFTPNRIENYFQCAPIKTTPYTVAWTGLIQIPQTAIYNFSFDITDEPGGNMRSMSINGSTVERQLFGEYLTKGQLVAVSLQSAGNFGTTFNLSWSNNMGMASTPVPRTLQYTTGQDTTGSVIVSSANKWCVRMPRLKANPDSFLILPTFSPIKRSKSFVVSAWVREEQACEGIYYREGSLSVSFDQGSAGLWLLSPTGVPVEGWQRIEAVVDSVPQVASKLRLNFLTSVYNYFVDDIRIHPFNASMKSFVYNPRNLRLMAELDENNYATFYEYDDEGTLIRVKKETEKGIVTIQETRSALAK